MKRILLVIFGILVIFVISLFAIRYFYPVEKEEKIITPSEQKQKILPPPPPPIRGAAPMPPATIEEGI